MSKNSVFVNLTNHTSLRWTKEQLDAASRYGAIVDLPFPTVPPEADERQVENLAYETLERIVAANPAAVCCQGEMTLTYKIVCLLKQRGIPALAATSVRDTVEEVNADGETQKTAVFRFCRFREY